MVIMLCHVVLCGFFRMLSSQDMMTVRKLSVMPCFFVRTSLVMFGCLLMMPRGMFVVFGCFFMMLCTLVFSHLYSPMKSVLYPDYAGQLPALAWKLTARRASNDFLRVRGPCQCAGLTQPVLMIAVVRTSPDCHRA